MNRLTRIKNGNYTTISNVFLRDRNISLKAKGFLAIIMSLPDSWDFSINGINSLLPEGKTAIYSIIKELIENGYCTVDNNRSANGTFNGNDYVFFETPHSENPNTVIPNMDNKSQINKDINKLNNKQKKEQISKENISKEKNGVIQFESVEHTDNAKKFVPPTLQEVEAYVKSKGYCFSAEKFVAYYESVGWRVGKNKMKSWRAACRTWDINNRGNVLSTRVQVENYRYEDFVDAFSLYNRKGNENRALYAWNSIKPNNDDIFLIKHHIKAYVDTRESQYTLDFDRYLNDREYNNIIMYRNVVVFDPNRVKDKNGYYPTNLHYNKDINMYVVFNFNPDTDKVYDGYKDSDRPSSAKVICNGRIYQWNTESYKWVRIN